MKCNTDPRKTLAISALQEQMIETKVWKKIKGLVEDNKSKSCGEHRETMHHLLSGCKKLAGAEYVKQYNNTLKVIAVKLALESGLLL